MFKYHQAKLIRKSKKVSVRQLSGLMGVLPNTLYRWEVGISKPSENDIRILALLLKVKIEDISDLTELPSLNQNNKFSFEGSSELKYNKHFYELDNLINEFGELPSVNLKSLYDLKNSCIEYCKINNLLTFKNTLYEKILDEVPYIIYIKDYEYKFKYVNRAYTLNAPKYYKEDIIGYKAADIFGLKEIQDILVLEQKAFKENIKINNLLVNIPCSGQKRQGVITIIPFKYINDKVTEIICCIKDTTEFTKSIMQLNWLKFIINNSSDAVFVKFNNCEKYEFISENIKEITGYSAKDYYKNSNLRYELIHKDDLSNYKYKEKITEKKSLKIKYRVICKDGCIKLVESIVYYTIDPSTNNILMITVDRLVNK